MVTASSGVESAARPPSLLKSWLKALRVHQYAKNILIFVPVFTSRSFTQDALVSSLTAFVAFCACASAVYIINDLVDIEADRAHRTKKNRPFASGAIAPVKGLIAAPILLAASAALAYATRWEFAVALGVYFAITVAYSFDLKRRMIVDVIVLAMLYTIRVIAGAVAIGVMVSEWLLAFSVFIFLCLALIKRTTELGEVIDRGLPDPKSRNYKAGDYNVIQALSAVAGFNAVTIFTLYISSDEVKSQYVHPDLLWLVCPVLLYWIGRAIMMANRRLMNEDPIVFAIGDRNSWLAAAIVLGLMGAAALPL